MEHPADTKFFRGELVSIKDIYKIQVFLNTGYVMPTAGLRLSRSDSKYIKDHFPVYYDEKRKKYVSTQQEVFRVFKEDYTERFEKEKINNYTDLQNMIPLY